MTCSLEIEVNLLSSLNGFLWKPNKNRNMKSVCIQLIWLYNLLTWTLSMAYFLLSLTYDSSKPWSRNKLNCKPWTYSLFYIFCQQITVTAEHAYFLHHCRLKCLPLSKERKGSKLGENSHCQIPFTLLYSDLSLNIANYLEY